MMAPEINSYRFGEIVIDHKSFHKDIFIFSDRVYPNWRRVSSHSLVFDDLKEIHMNPPSILIIGQGSYSRMTIPEKTRKQLSEAGIQLIALPTSDACDAYNHMRLNEVVAAAFHLTC